MKIQKETVKKMSLNIRPMLADDICHGMRLSMAEGWNQTENDWKLFIENPNNVCLLAEANGKVIGTSTAINYANEEAWIGMVLVDKSYRGFGISKALLTEIFEKVACYKSIKLDATPAGQQVYQKFGFMVEYFIARMTNLSLKNLPAIDSDIQPEPIQSKDVEQIIAFDEIVFGANRRQLIEYLLKECLLKGWLLKRDNKIEGFVLGRAGSRYYHVGPLAALNSNDAKLLFSEAMKNLINRPIVIDVVWNRQELVSWLNKMGFVKQRHFIRMFKNVNPLPGETDMQFLICGPEFG